MDFRSLYDENVRFVWRAVARLGVPERDLPDAVQEVFVVAHRKLPEFEGRSKLSTWLFGIATRVAADRRASAYARRELPSAETPELDDGIDVAALVDQRHARRLLERILDRMPDEQRLVFTLFELEEMTGEEIAELTGVPVGTVRSRLRLARQTFEQATAQLQARERSGCKGVLSPREA